MRLDRIGMHRIRQDVLFQRLFDLLHHMQWHRLHRDHALGDVLHPLRAQQRQHLGGHAGVDVVEDRRGGLVMLALEVIGDHRLIQRAKAAPHGALSLAVLEPLHDAGHLFFGHEFAQHGFRRRQRPHDRTGAADDLLGELFEHMFHHLCRDRAKAAHGAGDTLDLGGAELLHEFRSGLLAKAEKGDGGFGRTVQILHRDGLSAGFGKGIGRHEEILSVQVSHRQAAHSFQSAIPPACTNRRSAQRRSP